MEFLRAERELQRAIDPNPSYPYAHQWYAELLWATGRYDQALKEIRKALNWSPFTPILNANWG
jgi:Tfp pilus assembly protein PilF